MKVIEPGHVYDLDDLKSDTTTRFQFHMDPDIHEGKALNGPSCQELTRVLIDRVNHLDMEKPWFGNEQIITHLRSVIALFESRAMMRKIENGELDIENVSLDTDGHIRFTK